MVNQLIEKYKQYKKQHFLQQPSKFQQKYAFIGVGGHSINNLYPCIDHLGVPLKYVFSRKIRNAQQMAGRYLNCTGIDRLETILEDPDVKGVFICSHPGNHFELAKQVMEAGKSVFIEKPPGQNLQEVETLEQLAKNYGVTCLVGLQKRYATTYQLLKKQLSKVNSYSFRYITGAYPEGDPVMDLFIHPVDLVHFLFGEATILSNQRVDKKGNITIFLHLQHAENVIGSLELSTDYTWNEPEEILTVTTEKGIYDTANCAYLNHTAKPASLMGVPLEKVLKLTPKREILYHNSGFVPLANYNQVYTQGYYGEIENFVNLVEGNKGVNLSSPADVKGSFEILEKLL